jgi:hypothetical protein
MSYNPDEPLALPLGGREGTVLKSGEPKLITVQRVSQSIKTPSYPKLLIGDSIPHPHSHTYQAPLGTYTLTPVLSNGSTFGTCPLGHTRCVCTNKSFRSVLLGPTGTITTGTSVADANDPNHVHTYTKMIYDTLLPHDTIIYMMLSACGALHPDCKQDDSEYGAEYVYMPEGLNTVESYHLETVDASVPISVGGGRHNHGYFEADITNNYAGIFGFPTPMYLTQDTITCPSSHANCLAVDPRLYLVLAVGIDGIPWYTSTYQPPAGILIEDCYATGDVTGLAGGSDVAGFIGGG